MEHYGNSMKSINRLIWLDLHLMRCRSAPQHRREILLKMKVDLGAGSYNTLVRDMDKLKGFGAELVATFGGWYSSSPAFPVTQITLDGEVVK
jgi:hypothetical protein